MVNVAITVLFKIRVVKTIAISMLSNNSKRFAFVKLTHSHFSKLSHFCQNLKPSVEVLKFANVVEYTQNNFKK